MAGSDPRIYSRTVPPIGSVGAVIMGTLLFEEKFRTTVPSTIWADYLNPDAKMASFPGQQNCNI